MRVFLIVLSMCLVIDTVVYDGMYLRMGVNEAKYQSYTISRDLQRWMTR